MQYYNNTSYNRNYNSPQRYYNDRSRRRDETQDENTNIYQLIDVDEISQQEYDQSIDRENIQGIPRNIYNRFVAYEQDPYEVYMQYPDLPPYTSANIDYKNFLYNTYCTNDQTCPSFPISYGYDIVPWTQSPIPYGLEQRLTGIR